MPPLLFASCLSAGCLVAPVVTPLPTPPRDLASTSSLPSGCYNLQRPTYCVATASCPLAASASRRAPSASQRVAASQLAVSLPSPMRTRCCCQCVCVFAVIAIAIFPSAIVTLVARHQAGVIVVIVVVNVGIRHHRRCRRIPLCCCHRCQLRCLSRCHNCRPSRHCSRGLVARRAAAIVIDVVVRHAIAIKVDVVAHCAVAIIVKVIACRVVAIVAKVVVRRASSTMAQHLCIKDGNNDIATRVTTPSQQRRSLLRCQN